jgi:hypothetical protein
MGQEKTLDKNQFTLQLQLDFMMETLLITLNAGMEKIQVAIQLGEVTLRV